MPNVSKCEYYCIGICEEYGDYGVYLGCEDRPKCHYRQLQKLKNCLDEVEHLLDDIEKMCKLSLHCDNCHEILQKNQRGKR